MRIKIIIKHFGYIIVEKNLWTTCLFYVSIDWTLT